MPAKATKKKKPAAKKKSPARTMARKTAKKTVKKLKMIGRVTHFYDRLSVAIIDLKSPLAVGDTVTFKRGEKIHTQPVRSMQIDHTSVAKAKKGDVVGVQVDREITTGAHVLPA